MSAVTEFPAASPGPANAHFAARLAYETDPADVAADLRAGDLDYTVIDVRSPQAYEAGHIPGAISVPTRTITAEVARSLPEGLLVVYCSSPGCNGAQKAAARLTQHGRHVKEMLGGFEYWAREGEPIEGRDKETLVAQADDVLIG
jgi:rhodanese-related sulfurtransferase